MDKLWKKWQQRFAKKNTVPPHVGGHTDSVGIAEQFKQAFTARTTDVLHCVQLYLSYFLYCLIHKYDSYMATSDLQFGF